MPSKPTQAQIESIDIPWHKVGCVLKAVAIFLYCERNGGTQCVETLANDIRACFRS